MEFLNVAVEVLNPFKFLVAVLIREYSRLRRDLNAESSAVKFASTWKEKEREDCKSYLAAKGVLESDKLIVSGREAFDTLRLLQHLARSPERDFADLVHIIRPVVKKAHLMLFQRTVEILRRDDLEEVSRYVETNFVPVLQLLKIDGTIGAVFMRNVRLLFEEMSYSAYDRFSAHLLDYINAGFHILESPVEEIRPSNSSDKFPSTVVTASQTNYVLSKEANLISRNSCVAGDPQLSRIFDSKPPLENANYVRFLESVRTKNFGQAMDSLHRYYTLKDPFEEKSVENGGSFKPGEANLHLCIMHYNAGHHQLAVQSLRECIFLAQQKGDVHLLTHAMYWLASLEINNNQYEKLFRGASGGDFVKFPEISAQFGSLISRFDALFGADLTKVTKDLDFVEQTDDSINSVTLVQQYSTRAVFWNLYGFDEIATAYAQGCLQIFSKPENGRFSIATDSVAVAANILLHQSVRFKDESALKSLPVYFRSIFPANKSHDWHIWGQGELLWKYQLEFNRGNYDHAESLLEHLIKLDPAEASIRKAELLAEKDFRPRVALGLVNSMLKSCSEASAHVAHLTTTSTKLQLRLLLLKTRVLLKNNCSLDALKCGMEALALATDHPSELWKARTKLQLGYVFLQLDEPSQATACLDVCFSVLNGCGYKADEGAVWFLKGKLLLAEKTERGFDETTVMCFERALEAFSFCDRVRDMLSCLYLLAVIYERAGSAVRRDAFSKLFLDLSDRYPQFSESLSVS